MRTRASDRRATFRGFHRPAWVRAAALAALAWSLTAAAQDPKSLNPLYRELLEKGVDVAADRFVPLPAPTMKDGLSRAQQQEVIERIVQNEYPLEEFLRKSVVSRYLMTLDDVQPADPKTPAKALDVWFIAHGSLETLADRDFLDRVLGANQNQGSGETLPPEAIEGKKIARDPARAPSERFGRIDVDILDRVRLQVVGRTDWSRTDDSIVVAGKVEPAFLGDEKYPNQWRSLEKKRAGQFEVGPPHPYRGAGYYVKFTRLEEPEGALFVEAHSVFTEPEGWFGGANLLLSKLPPIVENQVRTIRRELQKAGGPQ